MEPADGDDRKRCRQELADAGWPDKQQRQADGGDSDVCHAEPDQLLHLRCEEEHADARHEAREHDMRHVGDEAADACKPERDLDGPGHDDDDGKLGQRELVARKQGCGDDRKYHAGAAYKRARAAEYCCNDPDYDAAPEPRKGSHAGNIPERHGARDIGCRQGNAGLQVGQKALARVRRTLLVLQAAQHMRPPTNIGSVPMCRIKVARFLPPGQETVRSTR